jgi:kumamolisin
MKGQNMIRGNAGVENLCVVLALAAAVFTLKVAAADPPTAPAKRKVFTDSVTELPRQPGRTAEGLIVEAATPEHKKDKMNLLFSLAISKKAQKELEDAVANGKVISREKLARDYSPKQEDVDALTKYLKAQGFEVTKITPDRTGVYARATAAQIEKALQVEMVRVVKNGVAYTAARNAPSLPLEASSSVRAIIGLQPFRQANKGDEKAFSRDGNRD